MEHRTRLTGIFLILLVVAGAGLAFATGSDESKAPVTLTVLLFDRATAGFKPDEGLQAKYIQDEVKKALNYDVKFMTMPRFPDVDKVNLLMAGGQAPDVSFLYDTAAVTNYVTSGGLNELTGLIDKYAPKLQKLLGDDCLSYGRWSGKQWTVVAKRTLLARINTFIRKDWLDKLGLPLPKTRDEWYQDLVAFKSKDPGNTGGKVLPYLFQGVLPAEPDWNAANLIQSFLGKMSAEDMAVYSPSTVSRWVTPGYKDAVRFLNKLYNEGLLGPDFMLDKDGEQFKKFVAQGLVGSTMGNWDDPYRASPGLQAELAKAVSGGLYVPIDPFVNAEGKTRKALYNPNGIYLFNPKVSKNTIPFLKYLEWMAKPEVRFFLQSGTMGVHYLEESNGIPIKYVDQSKLPGGDAQRTNWSDFCMILNGKEFGSDAKNAEAAALGSSYSPGYGDYLKPAYLMGMKDGFFGYHFDVVISSDAKFSGTLQQKSAEIWVQTITAKPAEFDALYDKLVSEWLSMGGQAVIDERRAAYKAAVKK
jgi:putative aldouronate transport system substrate-binding protein